MQGKSKVQINTEKQISQFKEKLYYFIQRVGTANSPE